MKYQRIIVLSLGIIIIGLIMYSILFNRTKQSQDASVQTTPAASQTQRFSDGAIEYIITPRNLSASSLTWDFDVSLDTHTGSLNQDLTVTTSLVDDIGKEYPAVKWDGDPPGGHHRKGIITFSPISPSPVFIELTIRTTNNGEKKSLRWNL